MDYSIYGSLILWTFLPSLIASALLTAWHPLWYSWLRRVVRGPQASRASAPARGSPRYRANHRIALSLMLMVYFCSQCWQSWASVEATSQSNYYRQMQLRPDAYDTRALKSTFRRLSLIYHPDRNPDASQDEFMNMRKAYETLHDPVTRHLYDRFGVSGLDCATCKSHREFLYNALTQTAGFYGGLFMVFALVNHFGKPAGQYWRFWGLAALMAVEGAFLTRDVPVLGMWTPAEKIDFAHQLFLTVMMGMSQLLPLWLNPMKPVLSTDDAVLKLAMLQATRDREAGVLQNLIMAPFSTSESQRVVMQRKLEKMVVDLNLLQDAEYAGAYMRAMKQD
jgi:hypothetical protein